MTKDCNKNKKSAFTLLEISIVMVVISLIVVAVAGGSYLISSAKLTSARIMTDSAPMLGMKNLVLWMETTSQDSYVNGEDGEDENGNGLTITSWKSLNNQVFGQVATATGSPTYSKTAINGMPGIYFNGSTDYFSIPDSQALSATGDMTLFAVIINTKTTQSNILAKSYNDSYRWRINNGVAGHWFLLDDGVTQTTDIGNEVERNIPVIVSSEVDIGNTLTLSENKVRNQVIAITQNSIFDGTGPLTIGSATGNFEAFRGHIGEIIIFDRLISEGEKDAIFDYLSKKWVITLE